MSILALALALAALRFLSMAEGAQKMQKTGGDLSRFLAMYLFLADAVHVSLLSVPTEPSSTAIATKQRSRGILHCLTDSWRPSRTTPQHWAPVEISHHISSAPEEVASSTTARVSLCHRTPRLIHQLYPPSRL